MKKSNCILIILSLTLLINLSFVSAIKVVSPENISKEGVFTAQISGDFSQPVLKNNIAFFRERLDKTGFLEIPVDFTLFKMNNVFYIYAPLTAKDPGIYQIVIEEVEYREAGKTIDDDIVMNFTITEELSDFSFSPGYIDADDDFSIQVENFQGEDITLTLQMETITGEEGGIVYFEEDENTKEFTLTPGKHTINFNADLIGATTKILYLSTENNGYSIPVSLTVEEVVMDYSVYTMSLFPEELSIDMATNSEKTKSLYIYNTGSKPLTNVELILSEELSLYSRLSEDNFGQIYPDSNANFNLSVAVGGAKTLEGTIEITAEPGLSRVIPVRVIVDEDYDPSQEEPEPLLPSQQTCGEMNLQICLESETCSGDLLPGKDAICCVGRCSTIETSSTGMIFGWIILIVIIAAAAWFFFKKYKKVQKKDVNVLKFAQRSQKTKPGITPGMRLTKKPDKKSKKK